MPLSPTRAKTSSHTRCRDDIHILPKAAGHKQPSLYSAPPYVQRQGEGGVTAVLEVARFGATAMRFGGQAHDAQAEVRGSGKGDSEGRRGM